MVDAAREHSGEGEVRDGLTHGQVRGRGAGINPGNRFESVRLHVLGEHLDEEAREHPHGRQVATAILDDHTRSIINRVDSPDLPFNWTVNPYRGCEHGCVYCYARPTHELLGFSCGLDFETKIMAKRDAPRLLRDALRHHKWQGEPIMMSGVTDPYQPMEEDLRITRGCLEVCAELGQPVSVITKNRLMLRDIDLLADLASRDLARCIVSLTALDNRLAASMEPRASSPTARLETIAALSAAGVPVIVMTAPIIPGLNDHEIPRLLQAAAEAGAVGAGYIMLRLPLQVKAIFLDWLSRTRPEAAGRVEAYLRGVRDGELNNAQFGTRFRGTGPRAEQIGMTFDVFKRRYKLDRPLPAMKRGEIHRRQRGLFDIDAK